MGGAERGFDPRRSRFPHPFCGPWVHFCWAALGSAVEGSSRSHGDGPAEMALLRLPVKHVATIPTFGHCRCVQQASLLGCRATCDAMEPRTDGPARHDSTRLGLVADNAWSGFG